jgi:AcrR family transcriptional regulator
MPRILTQAHLEQFRSRLCDVAARLYFEVGHSDFNMRDLAARVGVSAMTPYRYFGDKEGILAAVRARGVTRLVDQLEAELPRGPAAVIQAYICFAMGETAYYRLIFDLSQSPSRQAEAASQEHRIHATISAAIAAERSSAEAEIIARSLWAALHGAICLVIAGKLCEAELGDLASQLTLMALGIRQHFAVPPIQAPPARNAYPISPPGTVHASAEHIARNKGYASRQEFDQPLP